MSFIFLQNEIKIFLFSFDFGQFWQWLEMATKVDNRVRFPTQSTSVLNMRNCSVFVNIKTQYLVVIDFHIHLKTAPLPWRSSALYSDWNGPYYCYRYFAKIESKARFQHVVLQRSADERLSESKIHRGTDALLALSSMLSRVDVVLNRTVIDCFWPFNNLCGSYLQSQIELYHVSWWYLTLVIDLIGKLSHNVIGCLPVKLS